MRRLPTIIAFYNALHNVITPGNRPHGRLVRIAVVGSGYVGIATGVSLGAAGNTVTCVDNDVARVEGISRGTVPFYDPKLSARLRILVKGRRLNSTSDTAEATSNSDIIFLCVGTPIDRNGGLDTSHLIAAARAVSEGLAKRNRQLVVVKSTVPPGTTEAKVIPALEAKSGLHLGEFFVVVNPEFLREGSALADALHPSHIILGERGRTGGDRLMKLFVGRHCPKFRTSLAVAELAKFATNAYLASRISFANEIANLCTRLNIDADEVLHGMGLDPRVGLSYLEAGVGFGGSCLPKDAAALAWLARSTGYSFSVLEAALSVNDQQPLEAVRLLEQEVGPLEGRRIALLGLAFKAGTDDLRGSRAIPLASLLLSRGAEVVGYDPAITGDFAKELPGVVLTGTIEDALRGANGCLIQASWPQFEALTKREFSLMATPVVIDGRRTWDKERVPKGIVYRRIGSTQ